MAKNEPRFLTVKDVAAYLGLGYKTAYRLVREGEIPAFKVGGSYRVQLSDLQTYLRGTRVGNPSAPPPVHQPSAPPAPSAPGLTATTAEGPIACGLCRRLVSQPSTAPVCDHPGCGAPLCRVCQAAEETRCREHRPTPEQLLDAARHDLAIGRISVLVTAEQAVRMEAEFIDAFRRRMLAAGQVRHPVTGARIELTPAGVSFTVADRARRLDDEISLPVGSGTLPEYPHNRRVVTTVAQGEQAMLLAGRFVAATQRYLRNLFDTRPAGTRELEAACEDLEVLACRHDAPVVAVLASPTGWTAEAVEQATSALAGKGLAMARSAAVTAAGSISHPLVYPMLWNSQTNRVQADEELPAFAAEIRDLLQKEDGLERLVRVRGLLEDWFLMRDSIAVDEAVEALGLSEPEVREVFKELGLTRRYVFEEIKGVGWVLYPDAGHI